MANKEGIAREDKSSPNGVIATAAVALFAFSLLCGSSLWIPASRIQNLHARAIALAMADAAASFAEQVAIDRYVPRYREGFLAATGLSAHPDWDGRYFNRREAASETGTPPDASSPETVRSSVGPQAAPFAMIAPPLPAEAVSPEQGASRTPETVAAAGIASSPHSPENPLRVFFFGDSQVFSLGSGLSRIAGKGAGLSVDILAIHSSGFIRSDYYDWPAKIRDTFDATPYEAAVMMLGMNDHQSFRDSSGAILKKETPEWDAAYKSRCRDMIELVLASVPRLYWVGMPVVKNGEYERGLEYVDRLQAEVASEYSPDLVKRVSLREVIPGDGKPYTDSVPLAGGKSLRVMSGDGSHFTVEGGQLAMKPLFDRLIADYPFDTPPVANLPE